MPPDPASLPAAYASVVRRRRMVRSFTDDPVAESLVDELVDLARRSPSAGNTQPWAFVVVMGADRDRYWDTTLPPERRAGFRWGGLLSAPVLVLPYVRPAAYVERYAEPDKRSTGLGADVDVWPVPYWWVDGGAAVQTMLLAATATGLGACLFGQFDHETAVAETFGVPDGWRSLGTIALGWPDVDEPGRSADRPRAPLDHIRHRGHWSPET